ncbi:MAG TPA: hypothetical protein VFQ35_25560, partial [Polyangiaceae bacterium]|nr:hypothetical protein [Polyangiaceae bacterium]
MERTIIGLGFWGVSYVLGAVSLLAGCGEVKSLGENMGGNAGTSALGSGGVAGVGADTSPVGSGGAAGAGAGGTHAGTGGSATGTPYPLAPSVPVGRNCGCDEESQVCNAASECVPRCDAEGHCAKWLLDREVSDFYVDVGTLLFLEAPTRDRLGNLLDKPQHLMYADFTLDSPIWRVELPPSSESSILGHWNHVTYVRAGGIYAVPDDVAPGSTVENMRIETPDTIYAAAFAQGTLYFAAPGGIWQMNVDTEPTPRHILDVDYGASTNYANLVIGDALWFQNGKADQVCVFSSAGPSVECKPTQGGGFAFPQAAHGNDAFVGEYHGSVFRER